MSSGSGATYAHIVEIWHYAKRQMTWFKRDKKTKWFTPRDIKAIEKETGKFIE